MRPLGSGAMANVYLAEQESLSRHVAVKVLRPEAIARRGAVERFTREARAAAALIHGNIVQIHEVGCIDYLGGVTKLCCQILTSPKIFRNC